MSRVLSFRSRSGRSGFGLVTDDGIVDASSRLTGLATVGEVLRNDRLHDILDLAGEPADLGVDEITFDPVVTDPAKVLCIGVNYQGRAGEYTDTSDAQYPSVFPRFPSSFTGHDQDLVRPPESEQLDYEGEIVVVIGKGGRRIPVESARQHIAGLTLGNEGTIRDWVRHAKFNVTQGKNWSRSGAIGPWMVPVAELGPLDDLHVTTSVNGELRQDDTTASMKYPIDFQIHYLSTFTELAPGDLIFTGTPMGAGARLDPPVWLVPGDVVEVSVPEIGTLRNSVADEVVEPRS